MSNHFFVGIRFIHFFVISLFDLSLYVLMSYLDTNSIAGLKHLDQLNLKLLNDFFENSSLFTDHYLHLNLTRNIDFHFQLHFSIIWFGMLSQFNSHLEGNLIIKLIVNHLPQ